jgi:hypothetical protein
MLQENVYYYQPFLVVVLTQIGYTFNYLHGLHHVA